MRYLLMLLLISTSLAAAPTEAVMFFSPDCTHCHKVIDDTLAPLMRKHPGEVEFILINVATEEGATLFYRVVDDWRIPEEEQGVPILVIGNKVLIGSEQIPKELPALLERKPQLAKIEGLSAKIDSAHRMYHDADSGVIVIENESDLRRVPKLSLRERVGADPLGSTLAIALLVIMLFSLFFVGAAWMRRGFPVGRAKPYTRLFPFLCAIGFSIATYLGYVEVTGEEAVCGFVGNCEAVQSSKHAFIFGLLPVGVIGALGYVAMAALWFWRNAKPAGTHSFADWLLPSLVFISLMYSIYLTFLEPFVIGAICMWCLLSASIITGLLWLTHPGTATYGSKPKIFHEKQ